MVRVRGHSDKKIKKITLNGYKQGVGIMVQKKASARKTTRSTTATKKTATKSRSTARRTAR